MKRQGAEKAGSSVRSMRPHGAEMLMSTLSTTAERRQHPEQHQEDQPQAEIAQHRQSAHEQRSLPRSPVLASTRSPG
jgi:hypothetical protein